jgi:hypothetical protein
LKKLGKFEEAVKSLRNILRITIAIEISVYPSIDPFNNLKPTHAYSHSLTTGTKLTPKAFSTSCDIAPRKNIINLLKLITYWLEEREARRTWGGALEKP